jgi:hypothetical protein
VFPSTAAHRRRFYEVLRVRSIKPASDALGGPSENPKGEADCGFLVAAHQLSGSRFN